MHPEIARADLVLREAIDHSQPGRGYLPCKELQSLVLPWLDVVERQRQEIQAHLAQLEQGPDRQFKGLPWWARQ
jgi:hypothetical protein